MKKILFLIILTVTSAFLIYFLNPFRAPGDSDKTEIILFDSSASDAAAVKLEKAGFIRSFMAFNIAYKLKGSPKIEEGGYYLSKNMSNFKIVDELKNGPDLKSITFSEGLRKEQIGEMLKDKFGWNDEKLNEWNNLYTENNSQYREGVYFPDTYLIPVDETPTQVAQRMINNFNEKFAPYFDKFTEKNIKWTTALKIASIIQREAAGPTDMPLIAGVIWNRLDNNQMLQLDATIQYSLGERDGKWWSVVKATDIKNDNSDFNTYKNSGLPPYPISNPGISAINAVLNPAETDCIFYLHDRTRQIHCAKTYEEHLKNIEKYLN
jgi:UPF0755 protein